MMLRLTSRLPGVFIQEPLQEEQQEARAQASSFNKKQLRKIKAKNGTNKDDVIMVSASDYESLIASGVYESAESNPDGEKVMKSVYGKRANPYKHSDSTTPVTGPRQRVVLDSLPTDTEYSEYSETMEPESTSSEEGWSF